MQLNLNPKTIRKGKPLGLPYQGSKKKIARQIVAVIRLNGVDVHYNDANPISGAMLQRVIGSSREWLKTLCISRDEFLRIRSLPERTTDDEIKLLINSFGNNRTDYLYGKGHADAKHALALEIIAKHDVFGGYRQTDTYKAACTRFGSIEQLQRLQQLERLETTPTTGTAKNYRKRLPRLLRCEGRGFVFRPAL